MRVEDLVLDYGHGPVLDGLSFDLARGGTLSVIGPSGCGKSTLLYLLAGLKQPDRGRILLPGRQESEKSRIAFILQDYGLFPWKTVRDNLSLPLKLRGDSPARQREAVAAMLDELRLTGLEQRYPAELSGGQRQRVAVGRALITEPDVLLMDEPFSSLDAITREHMQNLVLELWKARRPTCVLVTHDVAEAVFLGERVMVLHGRPARNVLWLENPCFGDPLGRERDAYFALTRQVHTALGRAAADTSGPEEHKGKERACDS